MQPEQRLQEGPEPVKTSRRGGAVPILMPLLVLVLCVLAGYLGARFAMRPIGERLAETTPVAVLDVQRALADAGGQDKDAVVRRYSAIARRLAQAGYLVLDAQAVLSAPDALYVRNGGKPQ